MSKKITITVTVEQLKRWIIDSHELAALECVGVDNWEYYNEAFSNYFNLCDVNEEIHEYIRSANE